jgi:hypothetical protein
MQRAPVSRLGDAGTPGGQGVRAGGREAGTEPATPCSQRQIEQDRDLRRRRVAHVAAAVVVVRGCQLGPTLTVVNSALVARPVRLTRHTVVPLLPS